MYFNGLQRMRMFSYLFAHIDAVSTLWQESLIIGIWWGSRILSPAALLSIVAFTSGPAAKAVDTLPIATSAAAQETVPDALLTEDQKLDQQLADLQRVIGAPAFKSLPSDTQFQDLTAAAKLAFARDQPRTAYEYVVRASDMAQATFDDWLTRLQAAIQLGSESDAVKSLTVMAQRWPDRVANLEFRLVNEVLGESDALPHRERLALFRALYAMHWTLKGDLEPSRLWRELALLLLERGLLREAIDVSTRVTDVYVLVAMRADRRFDAVVTAHPAQFEINAAGERERRALESAADAQPTSLELKSRVIFALFQQQHYAAMLAETDSVLLAIRSTSSPTRLYEDYYAQFEWFLNLRSYALARNGRWDEAAAELAAASASGHTDQLINLGALYCRMGRPKEALAAI